MRTSLAIAMSAIVFLAVGAPASAQTTYTYDALGRIISVTYDNGSQAQYSYDAAGNRTQVLLATGFIWSATSPCTTSCWGAPNKW